MGGTRGRARCHLRAEIVEDYDDNYYAAFTAIEKRARDDFAHGRRHLFEAEMKEDRRTHGHPHHDARPTTN